MADVHETRTDAPEGRGSRSRRRRRSVDTTAAEVGKSVPGGPTSAKSKGGSVINGRYGKTVKKSVTLRETVVEEIEARTGARGFSEFLDAAAERHLALLKAQEILADHTSRYGELTDEELAEARAAWRGE